MLIPRDDLQKKMFSSKPTWTPSPTAVFTDAEAEEEKVAAQNCCEDRKLNEE